MYRGTWQATVHGVARVSHNLATKPPPHSLIYCIRTFFGETLWQESYPNKKQTAKIRLSLKRVSSFPFFLPPPSFLFLLSFLSFIEHNYRQLQAFLVAQMVKNLLARQETQVRSLGQEEPLEKEMSPYSSVLAWRIPWTEEAGGLLSKRWQSRTRLSD